MISCQETATAKKDDFKTGYIDTSVLLEKYEKFKDENEKFKVKSEEMGRPLQAKGKQLEDRNGQLSTCCTSKRSKLGHNKNMVN